MSIIILAALLAPPPDVAHAVTSQTVVKEELFDWVSDYWIDPEHAGREGAVISLRARYSYRGNPDVALRECWPMLHQRVQEGGGVFNWDRFPLHVFVSVDRDARIITISMRDEP